MEDEGKRRDEVRRGELARQVEENEVFQETVNALAWRYTNEWAATEPQEHKKREHLYQKVTLLWELRREITEEMRTGQYAAQQLNEHVGRDAE